MSQDVFMIEIVPGITADPERAFIRPVVAGTGVTAAEVLASLAARLSEVDVRTAYGITPEQVRAVLRYAAVLADDNLDASFAALWADPQRNAAEAELDRRTDAEIDANPACRRCVQARRPAAVQGGDDRRDISWAGCALHHRYSQRALVPRTGHREMI